jgi:hypothetical protein
LGKSFLIADVDPNSPIPSTAQQNGLVAQFEWRSAKACPPRCGLG